MKDGDVLLLENTRFHAGEEKNDPAFVKALAKLGDVYVNDAFSAAHRAHASTEGLAHLLPAYAGRAMQAELEALAKGLEAPARPVVAVVGGAKVSTKIDLLENLVAKVDALVIGGGMANTFLHAIDIGVGRSLAERDLGATARSASSTRRARPTAPSSCRSTRWWPSEFKADAPHHTYGIDAIPADGMILDVGSQSIDRVNAAINDAATLVWNGPLGAFEHVALRPGHGGGGAPRRRAHPRRQARLGGRRRRHRRGAQPRRRRRPVHLRLDRRRRLPRMARRQGAAGRRGFAPLEQCDRSRALRRAPMKSEGE